MDSPCSTATEVDLVVHVAVDYICNQGIGIGIVRRLVHAEPGDTMCTGPLAHEPAGWFPDRKFGITPGLLRDERFNTPERAHIFAADCAVSMALSPVRFCLSQAQPLRKIRILLTPGDEKMAKKAVEIMQRHSRGGPHLRMQHAADRKAITGLTRNLRKLEFNAHGARVEFNFGAADCDGSTLANYMARQKGRQACIARRHERQVQDRLQRQNAARAARVAMTAGTEQMIDTEMTDGSVYEPSGYDILANMLLPLRLGNDTT